MSSMDLNNLSTFDTADRAHGQTRIHSTFKQDWHVVTDPERTLQPDTKQRLHFIEQRPVGPQLSPYGLQLAVAAAAPFAGDGRRAQQLGLAIDLHRGPQLEAAAAAAAAAMEARKAARVEEAAKKKAAAAKAAATAPPPKKAAK
jgi:hypothetical protein